MRRLSFLIILVATTFVPTYSGDMFITSRASNLIDSTYRVSKFYQEGYTTDTCFILTGEMGDILIEKDAVDAWVKALTEGKTTYNEWAERAHNKGLSDFHKAMSITFPAFRLWSQRGITSEVTYSPVFYMKQGQAQWVMEGNAPLPQYSTPNTTCRVKFSLVVKQSAHFDEIIRLLTTGDCPVLKRQIKEGKSAFDDFFKK